MAPYHVFFVRGILSFMLSLFPQLLFLSPFAAFIIRLALGAIFAYSAWTRLSKKGASVKTFGVIDGLLAVLLITGAYTQAAALGGLVCTAAWLIKPDWNPYPKTTTALALVMCLSILVMGAGLLAFDLPL